MNALTAVAWGANRFDLFGLGANNECQHQWSGDGINWSQWESLGGVFASALAVVSRSPNLLDVFGLGTDFSMFHRAYGPSWSPAWESLGGVFTSPPSVVSLSPSQLDVFGLGTDHSLYQLTWNSGSWSSPWVSLGGHFTSQPAVVASGGDRIDVFAVGTDFGMHHRLWTATAGWADWELMGGIFISQPTAIAWTTRPVVAGAPVAAGRAVTPGVGGPAGDLGQLRIAVFGLGTDSSLFCKTTDNTGGFPEDWEGLGNSLQGAPAVVSWGDDRLDVFGTASADGSLQHRAYSGQWDAAWTSFQGVLTSAPTAVSWGANRLDIFGIGGDYGVYHMVSNGGPGSWQGLGGPLTLPGTYTISLDSFEIDNTRSLHNDTDYVTFTVKVGASPGQTVTQRIGNVNNGVHPLNISFSSVEIDLSDFVMITYVILNSGASDNATVEAALTKAVSGLAGKGTQAAATALGDGLASLIGADIGSVAVPIIGSILGLIAGYLIGQLASIVFADCDGPVAAEQAALTGVDMRKRTISGTVASTTTSHPGTTSNAGCGANSAYKVSWSYRLTAQEKTVPDVTGFDLVKATSAIQTAGLVAVPNGSGPIVVREAPIPGVVVDAGSPVTITMGTVVE